MRSLSCVCGAISFRPIHRLPPAVLAIAPHSKPFSTLILITCLDSYLSFNDSSESSPEPSTPSTSLLDSRSHIVRASARNAKHERAEGSLGLIDAARVRLSKDFRAFICSTSKLQRVHSISSEQTEEAEDQRFVYPEYANCPHPHPVDLDIEPMELGTEERHGRGLGTRIAKFLTRSRSRSRSKKRRSRSLDAAASHDPMPLSGASVTIHARHSSLEPDRDLASTSNSRPATRSPSRPLSTATPANGTMKPLPKKPHMPFSSNPSHNVHPVDIRTEVVIYEQEAPSPPRKTRRMNLFGLSIPTPRRSSAEALKSKSRPTTPAPLPNGKAERGPWPGRFRSNSGSISHNTHDDAKPFVKGDILWDNSRTAGPNVLTSQQRHAPFHVWNGPPLPRGEYAKMGADVDVDASASDGRCSPLCGLGSSNVAGTATAKGKERERARGARDRPNEKVGELGVRSGKVDEKEKDRERITHPRRVGSPAPKESGRETRQALGAAQMERVASGGGNGRQCRSRDGPPSAKLGIGTSATRPKQNKHGSFDFERPVSAGVAGQTTFIVPRLTAQTSIGAPSALHRSASARGVQRAQREATGAPEAKTPKPSPTPDSGHRRGQAKPVLDVNTQGLFLTRRMTGSSAASSPHPRLRGPNSRAHNGSEAEPGSPISSTHSANSSAPNSSWGKSAGKRVGRATHPSFKFEPAVPPIPGSPASDERKKSVAGSNSNTPTPSSPLTKPRQVRGETKGRSLDLGLGLSWAPSKVREEAMLRTIPVTSASADAALRARSRWRGPTPDEEGRLGVASDVAEAFREVLGDAAYATFKTYVHRFDAHAIPLDGPFGLIHHVQRLLDSAPGTDRRRKQALLDRFVRVVQESR